MKENEIGRMNEIIRWLEEGCVANIIPLMCFINIFYFFLISDYFYACTYATTFR